MSENNTTADCISDCISSSSNLLDDIEVVLVAGGALLGLAAWGYKKYKSMMADGKITAILKPQINISIGTDTSKLSNQSILRISIILSPIVNYLFYCRKRNDSKMS